MNQLYTNLPLSRKIASLGVECESTQFWNPRKNDENGMMCSPNSLEDSDIYWEVNHYKEPLGVPAYFLHQLIPVLQAIGAVKGWENSTCNCCDDLWQSNFLEIARLYLDSKEKAWKYLEDLLDNN